MNEIEAIEELKDCGIKNDSGEFLLYDRNFAIDMAIGALEKQIPKKPSNISHPQYNVKIGSCPSCGQRNNIYKKFCIECGQKLDWSVEE